MLLRLALLGGASALMLVACIGMEVSGSSGPRPGFVGVCGCVGLITLIELRSLGERIRRLEQGTQAGIPANAEDGTGPRPPSGWS